MNKSFFISTAIPYVNAAPHIGFALELIEADVLARFNRKADRKVFLVTGTDENALKNVAAAEEKNLSVAEFVTKNAEIFRSLAKTLNITNDDFIRTSAEERHIKGAQKLWAACKKEDIYKKKYSGLYCLGCEEFKLPKDLADGKCPEHPNRPLEKIEEENYFFRLSAYAKKIEKLIKSDKLRIVPESRKNEILSFIKQGLEDFSISRSRARAKNWGVSVPGDESQIMYVWIDALSNYINALGYATDDKKFHEFWEKAEEITHVIGKGINRFHTVYWPAILLSAGIRVPDSVLIHGYVTVNGEKISKSLGNTVDPFALVEKYGVDPVRYYLLREIPSQGDGDFSEEKFRELYNADLANGIGNFAARTLTLAEKVGEINFKGPEKSFEEKIDAVKKKIVISVNDFKLNEAIQAISGLVSFGDTYVNEKKPWETNDKEIIGNLLLLLHSIALELAPFIPETSEKILAAIRKTDKSILGKKIAPLFPRLNA